MSEAPRLTAGPGRQRKPYRESCPHPDNFVVTIGRKVCDPGSVPVCTRCGLTVEKGD